MTSGTAQSTLRKMMGEAHAQARAPSLRRQLRLALERTAEEILGLPFEVTSIRQSLCPIEMLQERCPTDAMIAVLEGEAQGAAVIETALLSGIVEYQTIGQVLPSVPAGRIATRVDAALVAPMLDVALTRFEEATALEQQAPWAKGYVFGAMVADARTLLLALRASSFQVFEIEVSLCKGTRTGTMVLAFAECDALSDEDGKAGDESEGGAAFRQAVLLSPATFNAVISRISVPLQELQALKVGEKLLLPVGALHDTRLEALGGEQAIRVTLGQLNGFRAVRMVRAPKEENGTATGGEASFVDPPETAPIANTAETPPQELVTEPTTMASPDTPSSRTDPADDLEDFGDLDAFLSEAETDLETV